MCVSPSLGMIKTSQNTPLAFHAPQRNAYAHPPSRVVVPAPHDRSNAPLDTRLQQIEKGFARHQAIYDQGLWCKAALARSSPAKPSAMLDAGAELVYPSPCAAQPSTSRMRMSRPTYSPRLRIPLTILFVLAVLAVPLTWQWRRQQCALTSTIPTLVKKLRTAHPEWRIEPDPGDPEMRRVAYLMKADYRQDCFPPPSRASRFEHCWEGLVSVQPVETAGSVLEAPHLESWGERGFQVGRFVFYGDPEMLADIRYVVHRLSEVE